MPSRDRVLRYEEGVRDCVVTLEHLLSPADRFTHGTGRGTVLADLLRRAEVSVTPDGFPAGGNSERVGGGGGTSDPVLGVVVARSEDVCDSPQCVEGNVTLSDGRVVSCKRCGGSGKRWADPVGDAVRELMEQIAIVRKSARVIEKKRHAVLGAEKKERGRQDSLQGLCVACEKPVTGIGNDRLRSKYCRSCYLKWTGWKLKNSSSDPGSDKRRFEASIRQGLGLASRE